MSRSGNHSLRVLERHVYACMRWRRWRRRRPAGGGHAPGQLRRGHVKAMSCLDPHVARAVRGVHGAAAFCVWGDFTEKSGRNARLLGYSRHFPGFPGRPAIIPSETRVFRARVQPHRRVSGLLSPGPGPGGSELTNPHPRTPASKMRARPRSEQFPAYRGPVLGPAFAWRNRRALTWFSVLRFELGLPKPTFWRFAAKRDSQLPREVLRRISRRP